MSFKTFQKIFLGVFVVFLLPSCTPKKIASDMTAKIMASGAPKMEQEYDVEIARSAGMTLLKMLETFQYDNPGNPVINTLLDYPGCRTEMFPAS